MNSSGRRVSRLAWPIRIAATLAVAVTAACGSVDGSGPAANPTLPAAAPEPESTSSVSTSAVPEASVPEVSVPEVTVPEVSVPEVSVPEVMCPR